MSSFKWAMSSFKRGDIVRYSSKEMPDLDGTIGVVLDFDGWVITVRPVITHGECHGDGTLTFAMLENCTKIGEVADVG